MIAEKIVPVLIGAAMTALGFFVNARVTQRGQTLDRSSRQEDRMLRDRELTLQSFRDLIEQQRSELDALREKVDAQAEELTGLHELLAQERKVAKDREFQWLREYADLNRKYHELVNRIESGGKVA